MTLPARSPLAPASSATGKPSSVDASSRSIARKSAYACGSTSRLRLPAGGSPAVWGALRAKGGRAMVSLSLRDEELRGVDVSVLLHQTDLELAVLRTVGVAVHAEHLGAAHRDALLDVARRYDEELPELERLHRPYAGDALHDREQVGELDRLAEAQPVRVEEALLLGAGQERAERRLPNAMREVAGLDADRELDLDRDVTRTADEELAARHPKG